MPESDAKAIVPKSKLAAWRNWRCRAFKTHCSAAQCPRCHGRTLCDMDSHMVSPDIDYACDLPNCTCCSVMHSCDSCRGIVDCGIAEHMVHAKARDPGYGNLFNYSERKCKCDESRKT